MANLNLSQIEDFSELGQSFMFKCNDKIYCIPPIPPFTAKKLMRSARDFSQVNEARERKIKELQKINEDLPIDQQTELPSDLLEGMENFYDFQINFIITTGVKEVNAEGITVGVVTNENIEGNEEKSIPGWSTQLIMKIFKRINEIISVEQEKKS